MSTTATALPATPPASSAPRAAAPEAARPGARASTFATLLGAEIEAATPARGTDDVRSGGDDARSDGDDKHQAATHNDTALAHAAPIGIAAASVGPHDVPRSAAAPSTAARAEAPRPDGAAANGPTGVDADTTLTEAPAMPVAPRARPAAAGAAPTGVGAADTAVAATTTAATAAPEADGAVPAASPAAALADSIRPTVVRGAVPAPAADVVAAATTPAAAGDAAGAAPETAHAKLAHPPQSPAFAPALGQQVALWLRHGVQQAVLQLNPAELGPVAVRIALDGRQAHVDFTAAHAATRSALETSLPALASALRDSGLTLAGGGVFDRPRERTDDGGARHPRGDAGGADARVDAAAPTLRRRGVVDLVA